MGIIRWIEERTFRRGSEEEYPSIKVRFNSTHVGGIQLLRMNSENQALVRILGTPFYDNTYVDLNAKGARELIDQLQDALKHLESQDSEQA